ncbi:unnamed protein product [Polarella glacialis]|uniref:C3H1-type domain-containing protein n=1 Tax=Polarella glacialis TaxID=89957 RepID=A0A813JW88_POLGL|nr:unnamed protein product [Polarella glacialis]
MEPQGQKGFQARSRSTSAGSSPGTSSAGTSLNNSPQFPRVSVASLPEIEYPGSRALDAAKLAASLGLPDMDHPAAPWLVRGTFVDGEGLKPSSSIFDGFFDERQSKSCPASSLFAPPGLEFLTNPVDVPAKSGLPDFDYPAPDAIRNTFLDDGWHPSSMLDGFFHERQSKSCPTSGIGAPPGLSDDDQDEAYNMYKAEGDDIFITASDYGSWQQQERGAAPSAPPASEPPTFTPTVASSNGKCMLPPPPAEAPVLPPAAVRAVARSPEKSAAFCGVPRGPPPPPPAGPPLLAAVADLLGSASHLPPQRCPGQPLPVALSQLLCLSQPILASQPTFSAPTAGSFTLSTTPPPALPPKMALAPPVESGISGPLPGMPALGSAQLPTLGSAAHYYGGCKPCAFLYSRGCASGPACSFCHLCPPGEKKQRQKGKHFVAKNRFQQGQWEFSEAYAAAARYPMACVA